MVRVPYLQEMPIYGNLAQKRKTLLENHREDQQSDKDSDLHCAGFAWNIRVGSG
jgi:hypothetical protein